MALEINEKEYSRLFNEKMDNPTSWIIRNNLFVDSFVNTLFEENKFLWRIVFDDKYDILKNDNHPKNPSILNKAIGELEISDFDHFHAVSFKKDVSQIEEPETISGIMNFPYISWEEINIFISKVPYGWTVFIINPILMRYYENSIGLFLTPKYFNDYYINECNDFIRSRTGYPLFLKYVNKDNVLEIEYNKPELTIETYVKTMKEYGNNEGLSKLLDFWADNECVNVDSFEYSFKNYKDNLPFSVWHDINFKEIISNKLFELVHEETGEILGVFHKFSLDKSFRLADTDNGVLELSDNQVNDLIKGKYDFKIIE